MPRPLCVKCQVEFKPERNDVVVDVLDGHGKSYQLWCADLWECPQCGNQIITGYGNEPYARRGQVDYAKVLRASRANLEYVYQCKVLRKEVNK
jgi:hypothetical protein